MSIKVSEFERLVGNRSNSRMERADGLSGEVSALRSEVILTKDAENMGFLWQIFKTTD